MTFAEDFREPLTIDAEEFIGLKSFKAKGKRLTTYPILDVEELEPKVVETNEPEAEEPEEAIEDDNGEELSDDQIRDEVTGQQRLFDDEE